MVTVVFLDLRVGLHFGIFNSIPTSPDCGDLQIRLNFILQDNHVIIGKRGGIFGLKLICLF